jgi:hypothetical protein
MGTEIKSLTPKYSTSNIKAPLRFENIAKLHLWINVTFRVLVMARYVTSVVELKPTHKMAIGLQVHSV